MILRFKLVDGSVITSDKITFDELIKDYESEQAACQAVEEVINALTGVGGSQINNFRVTENGISTIIPNKSILWIKLLEQFSDSDLERMEKAVSTPRRPQPRYSR